MVKANRQPIGVSTHSRPKAAAPPSQRPIHPPNVSTHSRPKAAAIHRDNKNWQRIVSTHSRPKAAAPDISAVANYRKFQHTAARRRLRLLSTFKEFTSCFNTQPPEGGCNYATFGVLLFSCFNTQPPEGGCKPPRFPLFAYHRFNTQPPEGGCGGSTTLRAPYPLFQHTAARRRLQPVFLSNPSLQGFNTQPPEGGCDHFFAVDDRFACFNTQPPEGGCTNTNTTIVNAKVSTHSRPKAAATTD